MFSMYTICEPECISIMLLTALSYICWDFKYIIGMT